MRWTFFLSVFESDVVGVVSFRVCLDRTYFAKIENWKHCSKIIFKCMNSTVRYIFNEKVAEKWDLWVLWIVHGTHWCAEKSNIAAIIHEQCIVITVLFAPETHPKKKKKRVKRRNVYPNGYLFYVFISNFYPCLNIRCRSIFETRT